MSINKLLTVTVKNLPEEMELITGAFKATQSGVPETNNVEIDYKKIRNIGHFMHFLTFALAQYCAEQVTNSKQN
jgi:hypothetical protein